MTIDEILFYKVNKLISMNKNQIKIIIQICWTVYCEIKYEYEYW